MAFSVPSCLTVTEGGLFTDSNGFTYTRTLLPNAVPFIVNSLTSTSATDGTHLHHADPSRNELPNMPPWLMMTIACLLVLLGGVFSGLNVGLLSLNQERIDTLVNRDPSRKRFAAGLQPVLKDRNFLLVVLLFSNSICMEAVPIFLDTYLNSWVAIVVSASAVLFFGEIIPQAIFVEHPIRCGYYFKPVIQMFMFIFWIPAKLISVFCLDILLDRLLGRQIEHSLLSHNKHEMQLIQQVLDFKAMKVKKAMIPLKKLELLDCELTLDSKLLDNITLKGYTRFPIYQDTRENVVGIVNVSDLMTQKREISNKRNKVKLKDCGALEPPVMVSPQAAVFDVLRVMCKSQRHMAFVTTKAKDATRHLELNRHLPKGIDVLGALTLENLLDEFVSLQLEILDRYFLDEQTITVIKRVVYRIMDEKQSERLSPSDLVMNVHREEQVSTRWSFFQDDDRGGEYCEENKYNCQAELLQMDEESADETTGLLGRIT